MKYKHGFIGNSSSASYYIRRGSRSTWDGRVWGETEPADESAVLYTGVGHTSDSYYSWHPNTNAVMKASLAVPVARGAESTTGVNSFSFVFYGVVRKDWLASGITHNTESTHPLFITNALWKTYWTYTVDTTVVGYELGADDDWELNLGDAALVQGGVGCGETSGFGLKVSWDGRTLRVVGDYAKDSGSHIMSCAVGLKSFTAFQDNEA